MEAPPTNEVTVRLRSAVLLSAAAIAALALSGCSADEPDESDPAAEDLCAAAGASGDAVESLAVDGAAGDGAPEALTIDSPLELEAFQRTVVTEGEGDPLAEGDLVSYALAGYDAETGEAIGKSGYEEGEMLPAQVTAASAYGEVFGCATVGSRIVTVYPAGTDQASGQQTPAQVQVVDVLGTVPSAAWGEQQDPVDGVPAVTLAEDGEPTIEVPEGLKVPEETQITEIKIGDGAEVQDGDTALVQYRGVKASDGEEFDSSWARGEPAPMPTTGVVPGFAKALVGQTVGSQVVAVIPKAEGYHTEGQEENELYDEDLIFVVDILATQHPAQPQG